MPAHRFKIKTFKQRPDIIDTCLIHGHKSADNAVNNRGISLLNFFKFFFGLLIAAQEIHEVFVKISAAIECHRKSAQLGYKIQEIFKFRPGIDADMALL